MKKLIVSVFLFFNVSSSPPKDYFHFIVFEKNSLKLKDSSKSYLHNEIRKIADTISKLNSSKCEMVLINHICQDELKKNKNIGILRQKFLSDYIIKNKISKFRILIDPQNYEIYPEKNCIKSGVECVFLCK